jgi:hypothetical protein
MTTAAPTLDARSTIPARLEKLGMSHGFFAELCGTNKANFSRLISGEKPMSGDQTEAFYKMLASCEELVKFLEPLSWTWTNPSATRQWFENPRFPLLFQICSDERLLQLKWQDLQRLGVIAAISADGDRMEEEIEKINEEMQRLWLDWLNEFQDTSDKGVGQ